MSYVTIVYIWQYKTHGSPPLMVLSYPPYLLKQEHYRVFKKLNERFVKHCQHSSAWTTCLNSISPPGLARKVCQLDCLHSLRKPVWPLCLESCGRAKGKKVVPYLTLHTQLLYKLLQERMIRQVQTSFCLVHRQVYSMWFPLPYLKLGFGVFHQADIL